MPGGGLLQRAWGAASNAAQKTAGAITGGAKMVGDGIVSGAKAAGNAVVTGAKTVGNAAVTGAKAVGNAAVTGAKAVGNAAVAVKDGVKEGVRGATRAVADAGYNAVGAGKDALDSGAKRVSDAYGKAKEYFTGKPPAQPCIACTGKDVDHDGAIFGYVNGKCVPLTQKGQEVTRADIENAKKSGYNPSSPTHSAYDPDRPDDPTRNTSQATKDCCAKCTEGKPPRTIFYVNGINTTRTTHCETLKQLGDMTCATVVGVYNATEGFAKDAQQTSKDRRLIREAAAGKKDLTTDGRNPAVNTLSDLVVAERESGRPVEIFAHSQGGAVTSLALYDANNTLKAGSPSPNAGLDENVKVTSFGSAAPQWVSGPKYTHYVHVNDATPMVFGLGDNPQNHAKYAGGGNVVTFSGERGQAADFETNGKNLDKHWLPGMTEYHGIDDDLYFKAYQQQNRNTGDTCGCGKNK
ncbi:hypothetical protein [Polyangium fumosum]|uniref:Alpha/beta hydrolase n=1 Tax=Polyangium fumosum TaxID=889272 RepID=A0A4U1JHV0_9BACT|nr:hypothetical protein [Polyangium fumosum]TKD12172.1 hypothetical protein E8A74_06085 [Polyangium fumosum]